LAKVGPTGDVWFTNCESCGQPLSLQGVKYHLTHSPNADWIRGINQSKLPYTMHREHVIQSDKYQYALQCAKCFSGGKGCITLSQVKLSVPAPKSITKQVKSKSSDKVYEVTIYVGPGPEDKIVCTCPWALYNSNQDQGRTMKWCSHVLQALKEAVDDHRD
jgi:hypothetical protein